MKKLLSYLAPAAVVLLASCSSEPSDWRPDKKVSLDLVAPGTRPTDNFDQGTADAPNQAKGGAITNPVNSATTLDERQAPTASAVMSADTQEGIATKPGSSKRSKNGAKTPSGMSPKEQTGLPQR
ncbi:hypothetical protein [Hymenobacter psoromatis]|uniref:hypothetical protein n=1 Tax=Hymenobacter psoromatis TaxID=1484116 RepID=UPI001CBDF1EA|nr:hypothetical protein [Hymenobacter psoromatis]